MSTRQEHFVKALQNLYQLCEFEEKEKAGERDKEKRDVENTKEKNCFTHFSGYIKARAMI